ncbi:MAG: hypothetical protein KGZ79_10545 [Dethiobacter sp.]|jgi:hypothetical protein|nr:hypothetical protein [Dethiobacter sp.]
MSTRLQELLADFGCSVLNYSNNKIIVDYFYSESMYEKFLTGVNCRQGMGLHDTKEILEFNKLDDGKLVIVQHDGIETAKYKYTTIFKATMEYKERNTDQKKAIKYLTFRVRKNEYGDEINYIDTEGKSMDFKNISAMKKHLSETFGTYKITEWSVFFE